MDDQGHMARLTELRAAVSLLTRWPVGHFAKGFPPAGRAVWAFPLVGSGLGAAAAAVLLGAARAGAPPAVAALLALLALACLTGGLHEDGLADTVDAWSGGQDVAARLLILRDSRIGAHGALALVFAVLLRAASLASLPPGQAAVGLIAAVALSRGAMLPVLAFAAPARPGGLGAMLAPTPATAIVAGVAIAAAIGGLLAPWALPAAGLASVLGVLLARRRFGGFTGDLLGATAMVAETLGLIAIA